MLNYINDINWAIATSLILCLSIYFSVKLKFLQLNLKGIILSMKSKSKVKPFNVLMITLAGRIGVGSIAGIALCIYIGGPGSIFWLWIFTILSSILTYCETFLGSLYKEKDGEYYKGGPSYYIKKGLNNCKLGVVYSALIIISYIGGFLSIQTNTIAKSLNEIISVDNTIIGFFIVIITAPIIFGGIKKISEVTSKLVPIMGIGYILIFLIVMIKNVNMAPTIFFDILNKAFCFKPFFAGFLTTFIVGIQRGTFSTEVGLGTASMASSISDDGADNQGKMQMLGIYITSLIICTATAFIILTSNYKNLNFMDLNGVELINHAFYYHFGTIGYFIVIIFIFLFSFSTILTGYYYGESCLKFILRKTNKKHLICLKLCTLIILFLGSIISSTFLWNLIDILVAILIMINLYSIYKLRKDIIQKTNK